MDVLETSSALRRNPYFDMRQSPVHIFHAENQHHYQNGGGGYNQGTQQQFEDAWGLERSMTHVAGEDFSIEELLNLGGLPEETLDQQQPLLLEKFGEEEDDDEKMDLEEEHGSDSSSGPGFEDGSPSEFITPMGDISDLEWVSKIVDDSDLPCSVVSSVYFPVSTSNNYSRSPSSGSMTSVSTSSKRTIASFSDKALFVPSKSRTKRTRTGGQGWLLHHPLLTDSVNSSSVSSTTSVSSISSRFILEPQNMNPPVIRRGRGRPPLHKKKDEPNAQQQTLTKQKKKKGRKPKYALTPAELPETTRNADVGANGRCCSHCGVQKTPQWRAGPMGSKTLCNACGVRYKSGRLLPEYRPAISPTFLDQVHSNSHRKVLEMRRQKESQHQNQPLISGDESTSVPPETSTATQHLVF